MVCQGRLEQLGPDEWFHQWGRILASWPVSLVSETSDPRAMTVEHPVSRRTWTGLFSSRPSATGIVASLQWARQASATTGWCWPQSWHMAMSAWQWCVVVTGYVHRSQSTTPCCRQDRGVGVWVDTGGRKSGGGGDLGIDTGGVVVFAGPDGGRVPYDDLGGVKFWLLQLLSDLALPGHQSLWTAGISAAGYNSAVGKSCNNHDIPWQRWTSIGNLEQCAQSCCRWNTEAAHVEVMWAWRQHSLVASGTDHVVGTETVVLSGP